MYSSETAIGASVDAALKWLYFLQVLPLTVTVLLDSLRVAGLPFTSTLALLREPELESLAGTAIFFATVLMGADDRDCYRVAELRLVRAHFSVT